MGNAQSSEMAANQPPPVILTADEGADNSDPVVISTTGAHRSKRDARKQLKDSLFGVNINEIGPDLFQTQTSADHLPTSPANSIPTTPNSSSYLAKDGRPLSVDEVASMLEELRKTATVQDLDKLHKALQPSKEDAKRLSSLKTSDSPSESPTSMMMRRSSLFGAIPGTATRRATLRKQPPSQKKPKHKPQTWSPDMFVQSPLTTIASMNSASREAERNIARSATPCSNYPQLGVHELGSLRVINGAASPQPSINSNLTPLSHETGSRTSDYFSAVKQTECDPDADHDSSSKKTSPFASSDTSLGDFQDTPSKSSDIQIHEVVRESSEEPSPSSTWPKASRLRRVKAAKPLTETHTARMALYSVEASSNPFLSNLIETSQKEDPNLPDARSSHHGPPLKSQIIEADLLQPLGDDESIYSERPLGGIRPIARQESRAEALKALNGDSTGSSSYTMRSTDISNYSSDGNDPRTASPSLSAQKEEPRPTVEVFDSSFGNGSGEKIGWGNARSANQTSAPPFRTDTDPELLPKSSFSSKPINLTPLEPISAISAQSPSVASVQPETIESSPLQPTNRSIGGSVPQKTKADAKQQSKKLVKKKAASERSLRASIVVQGQSELSEVPSIPTDVAAKHSDRMSKNPKMEHLEHTYDSVSACDTRPFSPIAEQLRDVEIRFPSPASSVEDSAASKRGRKSQKRRSIGPDSSPHGLFHRKSSKSRERRKSQVGESDLDCTVGVADFGTVAESLGSSPYDIAIAGRGDPSHSRPKPAMITHPHQIGNSIGSSMPRPKSMVGMDEKSASEWAFKRSKDRLPQSESRPAHHVRHHSSPRTDFRPSRPPLVTALTEVPPLPPAHGERCMSRPKTVHEAAVHNMIPSPYSSSLDLLGGTDTDQDQSNPPVNGRRHTPANENVDPSWEAQAKLWRQRRKSIGEGLRSVQSTRNLRDENDSPRKQKQPQPPLTPTESAPLFLTPLTPLSSANDLTQEVKENREAMPRKCPSPTVRERAQYFEVQAARQRPIRG